MSKKFNPTICFFMIFALTAGCAHTPKQKAESTEQSQAQVTIDQIDEKLAEKQRKDEEKLREEMQKSLERMVENAHKTGGGSTKYLADDLFLKASASIMAGDFQTANILFKYLVQLEPNDLFIKKKYAISLIRTGELDKSAGVLEEIVAKEKDQKDSINLILAGVYGTLGQSEKAGNVYQQILKRDPANEDACVFYSKAMVAEKNVNKAMQLLQNCSKHSKKKGIFDYYIGKLHVDQANLKKAKLSFQEAYRKQPTLSQAVLAIGLIHEELKENEQAAKLYKSHLDKYPDDQSVLSRIVQLYFSMQKYSEVLPYAERLSDDEPDNLNLKVKLGILYTEGQEYRKAISVFKELLQHTPDNDNILYYIAAIYQQLELFDQSIDFYSKVSEQSELFEDSSIQIAKMLAMESEREFRETKKLGQVSQRFLDFVTQTSKKKNALKLQLYTLKAGFLEGAGQYQKAIASMTEVKGEKDFNDSYSFYLASLYEKMQDYENSNAVIMELLDKDPKNAHAWNYLGYSLLERGVHLELAHEYIVRALTFKPHDAYIRDSLGWYYYKVGKLESALSELLYASQQVGDDYSVQKHLTIVYASLKKFDVARKWAVKAIKNTNSEDEIEQIKTLMDDIDSKRIPASE